MGVEFLVFNLTNACNRDCAHCVRDRSGPETFLPLEHIRKILDQAGGYGGGNVSLTGGEPLLHPQFEDIVDSVVDSGRHWLTVTNAVLFERLKKLLAKAERRERLQHVSLSIEGATPETDDRIRGEGHFRGVMKAAAYLAASGLPFGFVASIGAHNIDDMGNIVDLAANMGAHFTNFSHLHPTPDIVRKGLMLPRGRWLEVDRKVDRLDLLYKMPVDICAGHRSEFAFFQCRALKMSELSFDFNGDMSLCCSFHDYRGNGPNGGREIAGNIADMNLWDMHARMIDIIKDFHQDRLKKLGKDQFVERDFYPCISCYKYFGKLDWLAEIDPENEWLDNH